MQSIFLRSLGILVAISPSLCRFLCFSWHKYCHWTAECQGSITGAFQRDVSPSLAHFACKDLCPSGILEAVSTKASKRELFFISSSFCPSPQYFCKIQELDPAGRGMSSRRDPSVPLSAQRVLGMAPACPPAPLPFENSSSAPWWLCSAETSPSWKPPVRRDLHPFEERLTVRCNLMFDKMLWNPSEGAASL